HQVFENRGPGQAQYSASDLPGVRASSSRAGIDRPPAHHRRHERSTDASQKERRVPEVRERPTTNWKPISARVDRSMRGSSYMRLLNVLARELLGSLSQSSRANLRRSDLSRTISALSAPVGFGKVCRYLSRSILPAYTTGFLSGSGRTWATAGPDLSSFDRGGKDWTACSRFFDFLPPVGLGCCFPRCRWALFLPSLRIRSASSSRRRCRSKRLSRFRSISRSSATRRSAYAMQAESSSPVTGSSPDLIQPRMTSVDFSTTSAA